MPSWWPWFTEGLVLATGVSFAVVFAAGLAFARLEEEGHALFKKAHRLGDVGLMHEIALAHLRLRRARRWNRVAVVFTTVSLLIELNLYVSAHF